jgi:hypothetical protein
MRISAASEESYLTTLTDDPERRKQRQVAPYIERIKTRTRQKNRWSSFFSS